MTRHANNPLRSPYRVLLLLAIGPVVAIGLAVLLKACGSDLWYPPVQTPDRPPIVTVAP